MSAAILEIDLHELFHHDELRLNEDADGWDGYQRENDHYYWIDTRRDPDDWTRKQPVTIDTVRDGVKRHIDEHGVTAVGGRA